MSSTSTQPHIVILGSGFAAMEAARKLKPKRFRVTMVSPRNHFVFTPLLTPSTVGTVEDRNITEPVRDQLPKVTFYQAVCHSIDAEKQHVQCEPIGEGAGFQLSYDHLIIAIGGETNTFGTPGVLEHAVFLKEVSDARKIRHRILGRLEQASLPEVSAEERARLLHWIVVGGGPTGTECMAQMYDFVQDIRSVYPDLVPDINLTLLEAGEDILTGFGQALKEYTANRFKREGVHMRTDSPAKEVQADRVNLASGEELPCGLVVWSTGIRPRPLAAESGLPTDEQGFLQTDAMCRVLGTPSIFALGDTARMEGREHPATAQLAQQQGSYVAKMLNRQAKGKPLKPFRFQNKGMLAYVGGRRALADVPVGSITGWMAWVFWRSVYLTKLIGWRNKWNVLRDWMVTGLFGRETSRIP